MVHNGDGNAVWVEFHRFRPATHVAENFFPLENVRVNLAVFEVARGFAISYQRWADRTFDSELLLQQIRIREDRAGTFAENLGRGTNQWYWLELEIVNRGFYWANPTGPNAPGNLARWSEFGGNGVGQPQWPILSGVNNDISNHRTGLRGISYGRDPRTGETNERVLRIPFTLNAPSALRDHIGFGGMRLIADDDAVPGDVQVIARLMTGGFEVGRTLIGGQDNRPSDRGNQAAGSMYYPHVDGKAHFIEVEQTLTVGVFSPTGFTFSPVGTVGLLASGQREGWDATPITGNNIRSRVLVNDLILLRDHHRTVAMRLTETVRDLFTWDGTARSEIIYSFPEGVQVLGAEFRVERVIDHGGGRWLLDGGTDRWFDVWYDTGREVSRQIAGGLNALVMENSISLRPNLLSGQVSRLSPYRIEARFFLSIEPGYEELYGDDIEISVTGRGMNNEELSAVAANVIDPITVNVSRQTYIEEASPIFFGRIFDAAVGDVSVSEAINGAFVSGTRVWLHVEGSRDGSTANDIVLRGTDVRVEGNSGLRISPLRRNDSGIYVDIIRESRQGEEATLVFTGLTVSGVVIPGRTYNVTVQGGSIAGNFELLSTANRQGFFNTEPYSRPLFTYGGVDAFGGMPEAETPGQPVALPPVTIGDNRTYVYVDSAGILHSIDSPFFINDQNVGMVSLRAIGGILGLHVGWNDRTQTATLFNEDTNWVLSATMGETSALVNGNRIDMLSAGGTLGTVVNENGRIYLPLRFFETALPGVTIDFFGPNNVVVTPH
jgi:hypothetical protein